MIQVVLLRLCFSEGNGCFELGWDFEVWSDSAFGDGVVRGLVFRGNLLVEKVGQLI